VSVTEDLASCTSSVFSISQQHTLWVLNPTCTSRQV